MDDVEVIVEEMLEKHSRALDKEERERIRWMKSEADYFNQMNPSSQGGSGFMGQLMKALGGKGGIMGAGMAGGGAAAGIMILADIIKEAISNSKILTTILGTIGKALGLLIDVILLPFLPILTTGIIWLFQGIMLFYKLWNSIWTSKVIQDIGKVLGTVATILGKGIASFFNVQFGLIGAGADIIWKVLTWLWNIITAGGALTLSLAFLLGPFGLVLDWLYSLAVGKTTIKATVDFLLGTAGDLIKWLYSLVTAPLKITLDFVSNITDALGLGGVSSAAGAAGGAVSDPLGWLGGVASGGWLSGDSQKSTPSSNTSSTSSQTIVIQGYTDQKLVKTIENLQRTQNRVYGN